MDAYLIIGNPNTRKASLVRSLTGCFNRSVRDILIQGSKTPQRFYARAGALARHPDHRRRLRRRGGQGALPSRPLLPHAFTPRTSRTHKRMSMPSRRPVGASRRWPCSGKTAVAFALRTCASTRRRRRRRSMSPPVMCAPNSAGCERPVPDALPRSGASSDYLADAGRAAQFTGYSVGFLLRGCNASQLAQHTFIGAVEDNEATLNGGLDMTPCSTGTPSNRTDRGLPMWLSGQSMKFDSPAGGQL